MMVMIQVGECSIGEESVENSFLEYPSSIIECLKRW